MTLRSDCSMTEVEFEGSRNSDTGRFSQSGNQISMDFVEWNDRTAVLQSADNTMVMETVSGWTVTAVREGGGGPTDAGSVGGDCRLEVSCNGDATCDYYDSCLRARAMGSGELMSAVVIACIQDNSTIDPARHQTCRCGDFAVVHDFDDVSNIPNADAWALANCGWRPGVCSGRPADCP